MKQNEIVLVFLGLATILLVGCGESLPQVSGQVFLDGSPIDMTGQITGKVVFEPKSGGPVVTSTVNKEGRYALQMGGQKGARPGDYSIAVSVTEIIPATEKGMAPSGRLLTPRRYASAKTSGLEFTIVEGNNQFDLSLVSK